MTATQNPFCPDTRVLDKFIQWIKRFDQRHARMWAHRYGDNPESASCEAMFWGVLTDCGVDVTPNADLDGGESAPDFVCRKKEHKFYVEVTCIRIDTTTAQTSLEHVSTDGAAHYGLLNDAIYNKVRSKTPQCENLDAACVLAVGTFHYNASVSCILKPFVEWLLTGVASLAWHFDPRRGRAVGEPFETTRFKSAAFVRPSKLVGVEPARQPISALLVAGFGCKPPNILGVIHPEPVNAFDPMLLGRIPFCRLKMDIQTATLSTEWTRDPDDEGQVQGG